MRALEQTINVAYLGPRTTFSHQAAASHFGSAVNFEAERTIGDVFDAVERGRAHYGVVPIENSLEGAVNALFAMDPEAARQVRLSDDTIDNEEVAIEQESSSHHARNSERASQK